MIWGGQGVDDITPCRADQDASISEPGRKQARSLADASLISATPTI
jgi:hypothetical protein